MHLKPLKKISTPPRLDLSHIVRNSPENHLQNWSKIRMHIKRSVVPIAILIIVILWMMSGIFSSKKTEETDMSAQDPFHVRVVTSQTQEHPLYLMVQGQTAAARIVDLKAKIPGTIEAIVEPEGKLVQQGTIIAKIALDNRVTRLEAAKRLVEQRKLEYAASQQLLKQGFEPKLKAALAASDLANAEQILDLIQKEIEKTNIKAPFHAIIDKYYIEVGDFLDVGGLIVRIVELDPLIVQFNVPENYIYRLQPDAPVKIQLLTGHSIEGKISLVGSIADPKTRTFLVEAKFPNPEQKLRDGLTATVTIEVDRVQAHKIAPSTLSLAEDGTLGIKTINKDNQVIFNPVQIVDEDREAYWITGLPETAEIITDGHEYAETGSTVTPDGAPHE